jgi:RecA-family ATPase
MSADWNENPFDNGRGWPGGNGKANGKTNGANNGHFRDQQEADDDELDFLTRKATEWRGQIFYRQADNHWLAKDGAELKRKPDGSLIIEISVPPPDVGRLELFDPTALLGKRVPKRQWLMPGWVPLKRITALYGAPGEGKSTVAQMMATACAIGGEVFPGYPVRQCNSILHFCEDDLDDMHIRQEAINRLYGCSYADLGAMRWLPYLGKDNSLMSFDFHTARPTQLFEDLRAAVLAHNAELVVNDTLADVYIGDENVRAQVYQFGRQILGRLALDTGCAVMPLAHPSVRGLKEGSGESGSTGWKGIFKSHLYLTTPEPERDEQGQPTAPTPEDDLLRLLTRVKSNYARRDETIELRWQDDVFIPTGPPPTQSQSGIFGAIARRSRNRVFRELFEKLTSEGQTLSPSANAHGHYAPKLFNQRPKEEREGFTIHDFKLAMQQLLKDGVLIVEECSRSHHKSERLAKGPNWDRTTYSSE